MEIFGGFVVLLSIVGFFLAVVWFILPFVVFSIKGKLDRVQETLERIERRLGTSVVPFASEPASGPGIPPSGDPPPAAPE